jgi:protein translocase SecG subunit
LEIIAIRPKIGSIAKSGQCAILDSNKKMLSYIQIGLAVVLSALILVQQSEASLGSAFGGSGGDVTTRTRRGPELWIFRGTVIVACLFVASTVINLLY